MSSHGSTPASRSASYSTPPLKRQQLGHHDLSERARKILTTLCNTRDLNILTAVPYISEKVHIQHDDKPPVTSRSEFLAGWSNALNYMPDVHIDIKEACVDEVQRKVWVRSEISGLPGGIRKESIDMMTFDRDGMLIFSADYQRALAANRKRANS